MAKPSCSRKTTGKGKPWKTNILIFTPLVKMKTYQWRRLIFVQIMTSTNYSSYPVLCSPWRIIESQGGSEIDTILWWWWPMEFQRQFGQLLYKENVQGNDGPTWHSTINHGYMEDMLSPKTQILCLATPIWQTQYQGYHEEKTFLRWVLELYPLWHLPWGNSHSSILWM